MKTYQLTVTLADPRLGDESVVFEQNGIDWDGARRRGEAWAKTGYWASIYDSNGECVDECRPKLEDEEWENV